MLNVDDLFMWLGDFANNSVSQFIFANPLGTALLVTITVMLIVAFSVSSISTQEIAKLGFWVYVATLVLMFVQNKVVLLDSKVISGARDVMYDGRYDEAPLPLDMDRPRPSEQNTQPERPADPPRLDADVRQYSAPTRDALVEHDRKMAASNPPGSVLDLGDL